MDLTPDEQRLIDRVLLELDHDTRRTFDGLTPHELAAAVTILRELGEGRSKLLKTLWEVDYTSRPVPVETFLDDPYYVGKYVKENLFDRWKEEIAYVANHEVVEFIATGGIGVGKTTAALVTQMYKLHQLLCLRDPCGYYKANALVFALFSISLNLVQQVEYSILTSRLVESEYFRSVTGTREVDDPKHTTSVVLNFPNNIKFAFGSRAAHGLGQDIVGGVMDEVAFSSSVEGKQIVELYSSVHRRMESRFLDAHGRLPGVLVICSSAKSEGDWLDTHVKKASSRAFVHVCNLALYDVKTFTGPRFRVQVGDQFHSSRILDEVERDGEAILVRPGRDGPPEDARIVEPPAVLYQNYVDDLEGALRDIDGVPTFGTSVFIPRREVIYRAIDDSLAHPFSIEEPCIALDDDDVTLEAIFQRDMLFETIDVYRKQYRLRTAVTSPRFMHVDLSLTQDCAGLSCCHLSGVKEVTRYDLEGRPFKTYAPVVTFDFVLRIRPPRGSEIDLGKIRSFIFFLHNLGLPILQVTLDQFQSRDTQQILVKAGVGIESGLLSIDKAPPEPYLALKSALMEDRVRYYRYPPLLSELSSLQRDRKKNKVDHPPGGSKDVADSAAGALFNLVTSEQAESVLVGPVDSAPPPERERPTREDRSEQDWVIGDFDAVERMEYGG